MGKLGEGGRVEWGIFLGTQGLGIGSCTTKKKTPGFLAIFLCLFLSGFLCGDVGVWVGVSASDVLAHWCCVSWSWWLGCVGALVSLLVGVFCINRSQMYPLQCYSPASFLFGWMCS